MDGDRLTAGTVPLRLEAGRGGIRGWTLSGAGSAELDGLATSLEEKHAGEPGSHPNGVAAIDHLVVLTPQLSRTCVAFEQAGLDLRRVREPDEPGPPVRQAFFRLGEVIVEVVESLELRGEPARFWGITFAVSDLDYCAGVLGERLGEPHDAVQPGRRIATVRRSAALGLPVALIE